MSEWLRKKAKDQTDFGFRKNESASYNIFIAAILVFSLFAYFILDLSEFVVLPLCLAAGLAFGKIRRNRNNS